MSARKRKESLSIFFLLSIIILFSFSTFGLTLLLNSNYQESTSKFYYLFNNHNFEEAKTVLDDKIFILKKKKLTRDLNNYFVDVVETICNSLKNKDISNSEALSLLKEVKNYNILSSSLDDLILALNSDNITLPVSNSSNNSTSSTLSSEDLDNYINLAITSYNNNDYKKSLEYLELVISNSKTLSYKSTLAEDYLNKIPSAYKRYLLESIDELVANKYYTKALNILTNYDTSILEENDKDILNKINSIEMFKEEYQGETEYTSSAILESITLSNVNSLAINSLTNHFVYLNLDEQKTYVYEGSSDNWNLIRTFDSSTGIAGKETPKGIFDVTDRGEWFYSEEFKQGAKYWVQFMGDYLFHSVPFDKTQSIILDDELGQPSSHGCVRLNVEDAKWLYDNIEDNTKIIIN
ncbi:L,D-transpeptidase [Clostridium sp.]|uniref:L,D-transpeptidase n=1 Tax=Clostridium sp. TaxID=1506 RepID=UPI00262F11B9|nr:L,D-transpeptidase [Clostridium sp.]